MTLTVNLLRDNFVAKRISSLSALSAGEFSNKLSKLEHVIMIRSRPLENNHDIPRARR